MLILVVVVVVLLSLLFERSGFVVGWAVCGGLMVVAQAKAVSERTMKVMAFILERMQPISKSI